MIYLIGSLKNPDIPKVAERLRQELKVEVFDSWFSPGPEADDFLRDHLRFRGLSYAEAMEEWSVKHIYEFDKYHLDRADVAVMLMPSGKSGHLELGYAIGKGKKSYILFDKEPERFDVMHRYADKVFMDLDSLIERLKEDERNEMGSVPPRYGAVCKHCFQGSINPDRSCYSCGKQLSDFSRV